MKAPTLDRVSNGVDIAMRLSDMLHEHLGLGSFNKYDKMDEKLGHENPAHYRVLQAHHNDDSPLGQFIFNLSDDITETIYNKGRALCEKKFNKFNKKKTRLTPEILGELWLEVSSLFAKKIYKTYDVVDNSAQINFMAVNDGCLRKCFREGPFHDLEIPGLSFAIRKGPIAFDTATGFGDVELVRNILKNDLDKTNDVTDFYRKVRNELFNHWKDNYGLFNGGIK